MVSTFQQSMDRPGVVANPALVQPNNCFPFLRSRLRKWSRETGSAIPSHISSLILHTRADEADAYSPRVSLLPLSATASIRSVTPHRVSPELIESRNYVPMAFTAAESWPARGQHSSRQPE